MLEIILVVLALIAIVGACIYFYIDMKDHKATNNTDFEKINKNIESEQTTRLGNIKYVVDQVNTKNAEMDKEYTDKLDLLGKTDTGFGTLIAAENSSGSNIAMKDVTADNASKIKLMKDVSVIGSMSIKDLQSTSSSSRPMKTFKACGIGTGVGATEKCIQFPDSSGDTYLTAFDSNNSVVSDSVFKAKSGILTDNINNLGANSNVTISTGASSGNTITVSKTASNGIKLACSASANNYIEIKNGTIDIRTGDNSGIDETAKADALANIKINNQRLSITTVLPTSFTGTTLGDLITALKDKKVLTLEA